MAVPSECRAPPRSPLSRRLHCYLAPHTATQALHLTSSPPRTFPGALRGPHRDDDGASPHAAAPCVTSARVEDSGRPPSQSGAAPQAAPPVGSEPRPAGATSASSPHQAPPSTPLAPAPSGRGESLTAPPLCNPGAPLGGLQPDEQRLPSHLAPPRVRGSCTPAGNGATTLPLPAERRLRSSARAPGAGWSPPAAPRAYCCCSDRAQLLQSTCSLARRAVVSITAPPLLTSGPSACSNALGPYTAGGVPHSLEVPPTLHSRDCPGITLRRTGRLHTLWLGSQAIIACRL